MLASVAAPARAYAAEPGSTIQGVASVIDGDTLEIHGERIRIEGVDSPESDQVCLRGESKWPCGRHAAGALDDLLRDKTVSCLVIGKDKYRRNLGECRAGSTDIGDWMVRQGWAIAYRKYSERYVAAEEEAHGAERNLWAGQFEAPWDYRARKRGRK
jgi:endonuclease YncB( thermonuclease family)